MSDYGRTTPARPPPFKSLRPDQRRGLQIAAHGAPMAFVERLYRDIYGTIGDYLQIRAFQKASPEAWMSIQKNVQATARLFAAMTRLRLTYEKLPPVERDFLAMAFVDTPELQSAGVKPRDVFAAVRTIVELSKAQSEAINPSESYIGRPKNEAANQLFEASVKAWADIEGFDISLSRSVGILAFYDAISDIFQLTGISVYTAPAHLSPPGKRAERREQVHSRDEWPTIKSAVEQAVRKYMNRRKKLPHIAVELATNPTDQA